MKRWVALGILVGFAGCTSEHASLVIERQGTLLAAATDAGWTKGSVILAGEPGTFTFPHPLSLRFTVVDDAAATRTPELISRSMLAAVGAGQAQVTVEPVCQPTFCTAEVTVTAAGTSMLAIDADSAKGEARACFYYAVVDAGTDIGALEVDLEAQQRDCRYAAP